MSPWNVFNWKTKKIGSHLYLAPWYSRLYCSIRWYGMTWKALAAAFFKVNR
jgi:hypothetical protein